MWEGTGSLLCAMGLPWGLHPSPEITTDIHCQSRLPKGSFLKTQYSWKWGPFLWGLRTPPTSTTTFFFFNILVSITQMWWQGECKSMTYLYSFSVLLIQGNLFKCSSGKKKNVSTASSQMHISLLKHKECPLSSLIWSLLQDILPMWENKCIIRGIIILNSWIYKRIRII